MLKQRKKRIRRGPKHTACVRGKKVLIKLRTGEMFVDKFLERKKNKIFLKERGMVFKSDMLTFSIYKHGIKQNKTIQKAQG